MLEYYSEYTANPHEMYRELTQAFIDSQWDNTSAKSPENGGGIMEQTEIGANEYHCIEAWVSPLVGDVSSGHKDAGDFLQLSFKSIDHETIRGLYYKFDNHYWIVNSYNSFNGLYQDVCIRRCNNVLKIVDEANGAVFSIPCVIDYDLQSPAVQVGKKIITPNSHAQVYVQGNADTLRLFTLNTRFLLNGKPFKLYTRQDLIDTEYSNNKPTFLTLDLYLDEIHAQDDLENGLAYNGEYNYEISIDSEDMVLPIGSSGNLNATILLNGKEAIRQIVWSSSNRAVVEIDDNGQYTVNGENGDVAKISVSIVGNPNVKAEIEIQVANGETVAPAIVLYPMFEKIRQYEEIEFEVFAEYGGQQYQVAQSTASVDNGAISVNLIENNRYRIVCNYPADEIITLTVNVVNDEPSFSASKQFDIRAVSMLG